MVEELNIMSKGNKDENMIEYIKEKVETLSIAFKTKTLLEIEKEETSNNAAKLSIVKERFQPIAYVCFDNKNKVTFVLCEFNCIYYINELYKCLSYNLKRCLLCR